MPIFVLPKKKKKYTYIFDFEPSYNEVFFFHKYATVTFIWRELAII